MIKNILLIGINFYPEDSSTGLYSTQMAEFLVESGYNVTVLTGFPYYPQWKIREEYAHKSIFFSEEYKGIKILRFKQYVPRNPTFFRRLFHMLSFGFGAYLRALKIKNIDLTISIIPFTIDAWLALNIKRRIGGKVWIHVQDFEIDAVLQAGLVEKNSMISSIIKLGERWEKKLLDSADVVSTISYSMLKKLEKKTNKQGFYLPNWVDVNYIDPKRAKSHRYMRSDKFKVLYAGNIGKKQDWKLFIDVVRTFKNNPDIEFIVVGDGASKDWLISRFGDLSNIKYYPPVPYTELPDLLCSADLHILLQKKGVVDSVMPSKILGMMASAKPSLVVGHPDSEVRMVFEESEGGIFLSSNNPRHVVDAILSLKKSKTKREYMGKAARNYVINNYSKEKVLSRFLSKIRTMEEEDA